MSNKLRAIAVLYVMGMLFLIGQYLSHQRFPFITPDTSQSPAQVVDQSGSSSTGIDSVVTANNKFSFDLYSKLVKSAKGNVFYSPYSVSSALAMTYEGAKGKTADEMKAVFHFPANDVLRSNFAAIYNDLNKPSGDFMLKTANALWVQKDFAFLPDYLYTVSKFYGGKAQNLDFVKETESARQTINNYIAQQTNNKILNLIPAGSLDAMTRLVLTNAIYFKGTWQWQFDTKDTQNQAFNITKDNTVTVPMMNMSPEKATFNYADATDAQILEMPYKGDKISLLIILPKTDLASIEPTLTNEKLKEYKSQMHQTKMDNIALPKFEFNTKYFMNDTLSTLGMQTAFSTNADFSGMDGQPDLFISSVIHQAYVKVDEQGTEAAAATAAIVALSAMMPTNNFIADHPFIFIIQEKNTGNILFMGRVVNPLEK